jgi:hypothetical protein
MAMTNTTAGHSVRTSVIPRTAMRCAPGPAAVIGAACTTPKRANATSLDAHAPDTRQKAELLARTVQEAVARGVKHFNAAGDLLPDAVSVLKCLQDEGSVLVKEPSSGEGSN